MNLQELSFSDLIAMRDHFAFYLRMNGIYSLDKFELQEKYRPKYEAVIGEIRSREDTICPNVVNKIRFEFELKESCRFDNSSIYNVSIDGRETVISHNRFRLSGDSIASILSRVNLDQIDKMETV